ncbi:MAG: DUF4139 domain-containing protein, partial [Ferruginibacter sp.]|nr:DUF4139 domain-containing protein [Ferruginibacter sp.]
ALEDSAETVSAALEKLKVHVQITIELLAVLKANKEIKGAQNGLSVAELAKLMDYYKLKSIELQTELSGLQQREKKLTLLLSKLKEQVAEEQKKNVKNFGRLTLQLNAALAGKFDFAISYITSNAYWSPFYDLRADNVNSPLKLIYRAKIFQTTGLDWKQVKLSLSTSAPTQSGNAPVFNAWFLSYIDPINVYNKRLAVSNTIQSLGASPAALNEVVVTGYATKVRGLNTESNDDPLYVVNGNVMGKSEFTKISPNAIHKMQVVTAEEAGAIYGARAQSGAIIVTLKEDLEDYITVSDRELDVSFDIDLPYDVPSNGKAQTALLKQFDVPAHFTFYAVPKLDKEVFLLAEVPAWEKLNLLPGEANIIFEGTYIGKSFIDPSSTSDTLNLTVGRDKRVVVKREKMVDFSSTKFLGGYKKQLFTYDITVKNNKADTIDMLLKDQYPVSPDKEITVELLESSAASNNEDTGILTWKLKLLPGETKKLRLSYTVRYPKDKVLNIK